MTSRLRDWQSRLQLCLAERWARPFAWGTQDCCVFAADCKLAVTGEDPAAAERGTYSTMGEAARLLARLGGVSGIAATRFGMQIDPRLATVGDIGLYEGGEHPTLAVCGGSHWLAPSTTGLEPIPLALISSAWRVC